MRKDFENGNFEEKEVVLRIRVPKGYDPFMEEKVDMELAGALRRMGCELVASQEYRDVAEKPEILVNRVTLVRERQWENETWTDGFWVDAGQVPSVELFKAAVQEYLRTSAGFADIEATCRDFNWGDAVMYVPDACWEAHGIYKADRMDFEDFLEKGLVCHNSRLFDIVVDQDEVLIPDDLPEITRITEEQANQIYEYMNETGGRDPKRFGVPRLLSESGLAFINDTGKYYMRDGEKFVGFDYSADYEGFVEDFESLAECVAWLRYEAEIGEILEKKDQGGDLEAKIRLAADGAERNVTGSDRKNTRDGMDR